MSSVESSYDIGGTVFCVRTEEPGLTAGLDRLFKPVAPETLAVFAAEVRSRAVEDPGGELIFEGPVYEEGHVVMTRLGERLVFRFPDVQSLLIDPAERRAVIDVAPGHGPVRWTLWMSMMEAALDAVGRVAVHAACLRIPGSEAVVAVHAPSGTGKTTTALALAHAGFTLLSDDGLVLMREASGFAACGVPRAMKIHRKTAAMLPFVEPILTDRWDANGEQPIPLERLAEVVPVETSLPRPLAAVVQLARGSGASRLVPTSGIETLAALAADNVRTGRTGLLPAQKRKLDMLAKCAATVPTFRLEVGSDFERMGDVVREGLGSGRG